MPGPNPRALRLTPGRWLARRLGACSALCDTMMARWPARKAVLEECGRHSPLGDSLLMACTLRSASYCYSYLVAGEPQACQCLAFRISHSDLLHSHTTARRMSVCLPAVTASASTSACHLASLHSALVASHCIRIASPSTCTATVSRLMASFFEAKRFLKNASKRVASLPDLFAGLAF